MMVFCITALEETILYILQDQDAEGNPDIFWVL